jgi:hypothetical protein
MCVLIEDASVPPSDILAVVPSLSRCKSFKKNLLIGTQFGSGLALSTYWIASGSEVRAHEFVPSTPANLTGVDVPQRIETLATSGNYFTMLGVRPQIGRVFTVRDPARRCSSTAPVVAPGSPQFSSRARRA